MATPTIVTRIQNRRGTQDQFDALYPAAYVSAAGATSTGVTITVSDTTGIYTYARPVVSAGIGAFQAGTYVVSVDSATEFTVNLIPSTPLSGGASEVSIEKYNGTGGVDIAEYPNVLLPGELALCTDTRKVFIGNINGEYTELQNANTEAPVVKILPPAATFTDISGLRFKSTPFLTVLYSLVNIVSPDWNDVSGTTFSRQGEMKITAIDSTSPPPADPGPPFPTPTNISLVDFSSDVNTVSGSDISFTAVYVDSGENIQLQYIHNFPSSVSMSVGTLIWIPFN